LPRLPRPPRLHRLGRVALPAGRDDGAGGRLAPPCERCGEVPEQVVEIVETMVETREDLARLATEGWYRPL
jgi:hypothetical protein